MKTGSVGRVLAQHEEALGWWHRLAIPVLGKEIRKRTEVWGLERDGSMAKRTGCFSRGLRLSSCIDMDAHSQLELQSQVIQLPFPASETTTHIYKIHRHTFRQTSIYIKMILSSKLSSATQSV